MTARDLAAVADLANRIHPKFPERPEVLAEKLRLFPAGCFTLADATAIHGYCFSHPWGKTEPPALDSFLRELPKRPDSYFIHDLTLDETMRGHNLAAKVIPELLRVARGERLSLLTLVAVNGSAPFWSRLGFQRTADEAAQERARAKYDAGAVHMQRVLERTS